MTRSIMMITEGERIALNSDREARLNDRVICGGTKRRTLMEAGVEKFETYIRTGLLSL